MPKNEIVVRGRVVGVKDKKDNQKLLTVYSVSGRPVYIRFTCDGDMVKNLKPHSRVLIKGHAEASVLRNSKKVILSQNFIADTIEPEITMTEKYFDKKGRFFDPLSVLILISGTVDKFHDDQSWVRFTVDTSDSDKKNCIPVSMKKIDRQPNINEGDQICLVCGLSTPKKNIDGKDLYFEDLVVLDIAI